MAIQGAPRRLRGQNPNAPQIPTFSPNDFGGQFGNMQIGGMGGMMGNQPLANNVNNKQVQGNMGGGLRSGGPQAPIPITDANREDMARLQKEQEQRDLNNMGMTVAERTGFRNPDFNLSDIGGAKLHTFGPELYQQQQGNMGGGGLLGGAFGGMLPPVSMPVSTPPIDYSYAVDDTGLPQDFSYAQPNNGRMYSAVMPSDGGSWVYGPQGRVSTNDPSFLNAPTGFNTAPSSGNTGAGQGGPINNGVNNMANPYTTDVLTGPAASTSGPSDTMAYGGALLGGLLGNDLSGALQAAGG